MQCTTSNTGNPLVKLLLPWLTTGALIGQIPILLLALATTPPQSQLDWISFRVLHILITLLFAGLGGLIGWTHTPSQATEAHGTPPEPTPDSEAPKAPEAQEEQRKAPDVGWERITQNLTNIRQEHQRINEILQNLADYANTNGNGQLSYIEHDLPKIETLPHIYRLAKWTPLHRKSTSRHRNTKDVAGWIMQLPNEPNTPTLGRLETGEVHVTTQTNLQHQINKSS